MAFWSVFWGIVLAVGMLVFAGVAVAVTICGFSDVKAMFRGIDSQHGNGIE